MVWLHNESSSNLQQTKKKKDCRTLESQYVIRIWAPVISTGTVILAEDKHNGKKRKED